MALIPQEYGCDIFPQPHVSDINDTLFFDFLLFLLFFGTVFVLDSPVAHHLYGREHYRRMLRFAPLADFLKVLLITTWSPSSSVWEEIRIIIPLR